LIPSHSYGPSDYTVRIHGSRIPAFAFGHGLREFGFASRPIPRQLPKAERGMWNLLYQLTLSIVLLVAGPIVLLRRHRHYTPTLLRRLGLRPTPVKSVNRPLWIHAVSVGEVGVAATLAPHLPADLPLLITTITPTGQARATERFPAADVTYLPFDLGYAVHRFFNAYRPRLLILTEGDLWPTVLRCARRRGVPVIVINSRIGERSFRRLRRFRPLISPLFEPVDCFGVQTPLDRDRLLELGVDSDRVHVTGNLKFDSPEPDLAANLESLFLRLAGGRPILVAGSTMPGEEEMVLAAFESLGAGEKALLVIAPRHPERWKEVAERLEHTRLNWIRRSSAAASNAGSAIPGVVLLDTLGELAGLYRLATSAFVGGTLVPTGGHNPLEPARFGVPVVAGPSMENFLEMSESFDAATAWARVNTVGELATCWASWLDKPQEAGRVGQRGAVVVKSQGGALRRTLEMLRPWILEAEGSS